MGAASMLFARGFLLSRFTVIVSMGFGDDVDGLLVLALGSVGFGFRFSMCGLRQRA